MVYFILLAAALAHALWNGLIKRSSNRFLTLAAIRLTGLTTGIIIGFSAPLPATRCLPYLLGAVVFLHLYYYFILNAYRFGDLALVYPISRGTAPIVVTLMTILLTDEILNPYQLSAILFISSGILCLSFSSRKIALRPVLFALLTGFSIAGYTFCSGLGIRRAGTFWGFMAWGEILTGIGVVMLALLRHTKEIPGFVRHHWHQSLTAGILAVGGYAIALWAMTKIPVPIVAAIRETSVIFALFVGYLLLNEKMTFLRTAASIIVTAGIIALGMTKG